MHKCIALLAAPLLVLLAACASFDHAHFPTERQPVAKRESNSLDGYWRSDGYGYVMHLDGEKVRFFHATRDVCIEPKDDELVLEDIFDVYRWGEAGELLFSTTTEPYEFRFHEIPSLPAPCGAPPDKGIAATVDAIISFFSAHYMFFEERGIEWPRFEQQLSDAAVSADDEEALYDQLTAVLAKTKDAHVELTASVNGMEHRFDADPGLRRRLISLRAVRDESTERAERRKFDHEFWVDGIGANILGGRGHSAANDRIRYGVIDGSIGYIAIKSMGGFVSQDSADGDDEQAVLDAVMDRAISLFDQENARAVILDISINSGGYDYIARQIASRFIEAPVFAYDKFALDADDRTPQAQIIKPAGRSQYIGPVYLLTSSETVSAGELLTIIMRARPDTVHVGGRTRGALSTKLAKLLPNGWTLTLSNEVYRDHLGQLWEAAGIPPHVAIDIFPPRDTPDADLLTAGMPASHQWAIEEVVELARRSIVLNQ